MKKPSRSSYVCLWMLYAFIFVGIPALIAIYSGPESSAYTYVETFTDTSCRTTAPSGKIKPPDNAVCSTVDSEVLSYKYSQVGTNCQVWLYGVNDTTCSSFTPAPLLQWRCIDTSVYGHFIVYCTSPVQPYTDPSLPKPPVTATHAFKLGIGLGTWALIYVLLSTCVTRSMWKDAKTKYAKSQGLQPPAGTDVELVQVENAGNPRQNEPQPSIQPAPVAEGPLPASRRGKTFFTERLSRATSHVSNSDRASTVGSVPPPYERTRENNS